MRGANKINCRLGKKNYTALVGKRHYSSALFKVFLRIEAYTVEGLPYNYM